MNKTIALILLSIWVAFSIVNAQTRTYTKIENPKETVCLPPDCQTCGRYDPKSGKVIMYPDDSPEAGQIRTDQFIARRDARKDELLFAMRTRILTDDEMKEVIGFGESLVIPNARGYYEDEKKRELSDVYFAQARLGSLAPCKK